MITIYRMTDRIPVKVGPVEFSISPLTSMQKQEILSYVDGKDGETVNEMGMAHTAIKYQVKAVKGIKCHDGSDYQVEMNGDGLTDDSVSELLQLEHSKKLLNALFLMLGGLKDPKVKGVEVVFPKAKK